MFWGKERERPRVGGNRVCSENGDTPGMVGAKKGRCKQVHNHNHAGPGILFTLEAIRTPGV